MEETDWARLPLLIAAAQIRIDARSEQLRVDHDGTREERQAIVAALELGEGRGKRRGIDPRDLTDAGVERDGLEGAGRKSRALRLERRAAGSEAAPEAAGRGERGEGERRHALSPISSTLLMSGSILKKLSTREG